MADADDKDSIFQDVHRYQGTKDQFFVVFAAVQFININ